MRGKTERMANLFDYLEWRGDLTFEQAPLNEVDNLIFSWLSYAAFDGVVSEEFTEEPLTIKEAEELFFQTHDLNKILKETVSFTKTSALLLKHLSNSKRFCDVKIMGFVNRIDYVQETQFCAMVYLIDEKLSYVVFRGTDDTLVGWKEDFNMTFLPVIPAQKMALDYLEKAAEHTKGTLIVGGHSKGGNLAIYAGVKCSAKTRKRIQKIYNNDGPGFRTLEDLGEHYQEMLPKIETYVPQSSVVGMLLEREGDYVVVKSTAWGINQHDVVSWEVIGPHFVTAEALSETSLLLSQTLRSWLDSVTTEEREHFVEALYGILEMTQAKTTEDLNAEKHLVANTIIKNYGSIDKQTKLMLSKTIRALFKAGNQVIRSKKK